MPAPGPPALGRGVVVLAGDPVPAPWRDAPTITVDGSPDAVAALHDAWATRTPVVVVLAVDPATYREPQTTDAEPWTLDPSFELHHDRLHFLTWANTYDARGGVEPVWWWSRKAMRLGADESEEADVVLADGTHAWIDGGPRGPLDVTPIVHAETVDLGRLDVQPVAGPPTAALAPDQLAAVAHGAGPARIVAPAGSGKTRVLTERLRHLIVDRGVESELVLAVAYNKKAQLEMESRTTDFRPRVSTLNALGHRLLGSPRVLEEREVRRILGDLVPAKQRRVNTDPMAPYLEGLSAIRLGLRDPEEVEAERDDVPGLAALFGPYRRALRGAVDFDEQIYAAVELLLRDGDARRRAQATCRHLLVDELHDLTPAHVLLLRLLSAPAYDVFGVGDDDQCHPADTLIETTTGPVSIADLDPAVHRLVSWAGYGPFIRGYRPSRWLPDTPADHGFAFVKAERPYGGTLVELGADGRSVSTTPDHRVYARWRSDVWHDRTTTLLYLMQKGDWFRVGTCFLHRTSGASFGPSFRTRQEGADAIWILDAFEHARDALVAEKIVAANFGLPQTTFVSPAHDPEVRRRDQAIIEEIFPGIDDMGGRARRLLNHYGRDIEHPFYDRSRRGRMGGCTTAQIIRACNVIDGLMEVPVADGRTISWATVKVAHHAHSGPVYSLAVVPHHNYVADGIVVRNCIYGHAGADPAFLIDFARLFPGAADHPLEVNYRCPRVVVDAARTLLSYNDRRVAKEIRPGPDAATGDVLTVRTHAPDAGARTLVEVVQRWLDDGIAASDIAVLTRVNSLLLPPHVALSEAGIPIASTLPRDLLERTGVRAALAYLRLGTNPSAMQPDDIVDVLRRPSRGLPQWFAKWLRGSMSVESVRAIADRIDDLKVVPKVQALADDLALVVRACAGGTTRRVLEVVRDEVGLGGAMQLLDVSKGGQTASQLDDLDALLEVADLHPDPAGFEPWLRGVLARPTDDAGVTLSTVHRVKGMEWDRVVVAGVSNGVVPHRLAEDVEEERRVLHVAITRGRHEVVVLGDATRRSPFLGELDGSAPRRPVVIARPVAATKPVKPSAKDPAPLSPEAEPAFEALRAWRKVRAEGGPAYIVASDATLRAIAELRPTTLKQLSGVLGIGPTKLELYGEEILEVLESL